MSIESEVFKKTSIDYKRLEEFGFKKAGKKYSYEQDFMNDKFKALIEIEDDIVKGKVIDLEFLDEYVNIRVENSVGEFVNKVRDEYIKILEKIRNSCCTSRLFESCQANRLVQLIKDKYGDSPDFPWDDSPDAGVLRNPKNKKWYGLIMNIGIDKLEKGNDTKKVDILNVKLNENKILKLIEKNGYYKAYHMNKKNWITIILNDTLSDGEIMEAITESHIYTEDSNEWIIPANPKYYDVIGAFKKEKIIDWKQSNKMNVGDTIYIYVAEPYSSIMYKCEVLNVDIPFQYEDKNVKMEKVMKIKLLKEYKKDEYSFNKLKDVYGVRAIRGPRRIPDKLSKDLK